MKLIGLSVEGSLLRRVIITEDKRKEAGARERQLKRWSRAKKDALIGGDLNRLKHPSKRS
jgi:predicted GIY-YIG superfamily endonuclease